MWNLKKIAEQIINQQAALKGNHSNLHDDVFQFMTDARSGLFPEIHLEYYRSVDGDHGCVEVRDY